MSDTYKATEQTLEDWEAVAADQAMTIAMMKLENPPYYWGNITNVELIEELRRRKILETVLPEIPNEKSYAANNTTGSST